MKGPFKPSTIVIADAQSSLMGGGATVGEPVKEFEWKDVTVQLYACSLLTCWASSRDPLRYCFPSELFNILSKAL